LTKCIGLDEAPDYDLKGCSEIFIPLLYLIFYLSLLTGSFPSLWKQAAVVPFPKKDTGAIVTDFK
jgi:hypothetical protein